MILMLQKEVAQKFNYKIENMNKYKFLTKLVSILNQINKMSILKLNTI